MYGTGALLIREVGRRSRSPWPVMVVLGATYALVEEGLVDQMLFNPAYLGLSSFAGRAPIPGLGISARSTLESLALHTTGSTCVPIALVEAFDAPQHRPWLGRTGLAITTTVFILGSTGLAVLQAVQLRFVGCPAQFAVTAALVLALVVGAALVARRRPPAPIEAPARPRAQVLLAALAVTSSFWLIDLLLTPVAGAWPCVTGGALVLAAGAVLLARQSRHRGWGAGHRLAAARAQRRTHPCAEHGANTVE